MIRHSHKKMFRINNIELGESHLMSYDDLLFIIKGEIEGRLIEGRENKINFTVSSQNVRVKFHEDLPDYFVTPNSRSPEDSP